MILLSNDYNLGKDIYDLNNLKSCYGKQIKVFYLIRNGELKERDFSSEEFGKKDTSTEETNTVTTTPRYNLVPVAIGSVVSFTVGAICTKYGKTVVNNIIKAIA